MAGTATGTVSRHQGAPAQVRAAVVEDDPSILHAVRLMLEAEGYVVDAYPDGAAAYEGFGRHPPDIALIDLVMPGMDGMELVRRTRSAWDFPIIMVTGRDDEIDEALGLRLGADDYVHKPFAQRLLLERMRANLRRARRHGTPPPAAAPAAEPAAEMIRGILCMDAERHLVTWRGEPVSLTVTEFQLLAALARRPGVVKSRDQLMDVAYDDNIYVDDRTIDSHIKRLRKKLRGVDPDFSAIETLYGIGYRYTSPPETPGQI
ncbi:response regulator transcription factor [Mangrovicoccus algicola]|uniref:Response regulator transcription factor n=1 Tax=Mangrovicoccus algicola TaxID=2771008 RepID=A0A8J6YW29_9RHOB|nr:response regulator transcription factor [Mangrovicoccus algicola]MBE3638935.1 response regulator transcription factor [Mangrovicoccus algicola]